MRIGPRRGHCNVRLFRVEVEGFELYGLGSTNGADLAER